MVLRIQYLPRHLNIPAISKHVFTTGANALISTYSINEDCRQKHIYDMDEKIIAYKIYWCVIIFHALDAC